MTTSDNAQTKAKGAQDQGDRVGNYDPIAEVDQVSPFDQGDWKPAEGATRMVVRNRDSENYGKYYWCIRADDSDPTKRGKFTYFKWDDPAMRKDMTRRSAAAIKRKREEKKEKQKRDNDYMERILNSVSVIESKMLLVEDTVATLYEAVMHDDELDDSDAEDIDIAAVEKEVKSRPRKKLKRSNAVHNLEGQTQA